MKAGLIPCPLSATAAEAICRERLKHCFFLDAAIASSIICLREVISSRVGFDQVGGTWVCSHRISFRRMWSIPARSDRIRRNGLSCCRPVAAGL